MLFGSFASGHVKDYPVAVEPMEVKNLWTEANFNVFNNTDGVV